MKYNPPYGITDPNGPYVNGDPSIGRAGSIPPAEAIEYPQREIANLITDVGITPTNADLHQMARAIQSGQLLYAADTGTATAYSITLTPPPSQYYAGLALWVVPANSNSGPATINVNGLGARNIVRRGGDPLSAGDMPAGYKSLLTYSALHNNFELYGVNFAVSGGTFLPILTANTTWYVNASTGDDSLYDGTTPTVSAPHGPFKTIGKAMNEIFKYGPSVYLATINVAAGTYNESVATPNIPGPTTLIQGAGATQTLVKGPAGTMYTFAVSGGNTMRLHDLFADHLSGPYDSPGMFRAQAHSAMQTHNCASGSVSQGYIFQADAGGSMGIGTHTFNSGSVAVGGMLAQRGGIIGILDYLPANPTAPTLTFAGPFTTTGPFAYAITTGTIGPAEAPYTSSWAGGGNVTGQKWQAALNGVLSSAGGGVNWYPGTVAGAATSGGQYL